jgi:hypothetical protein
MYRARLASFTLAAGLLALTGCNSCSPGLNLFHRSRPTSDCCCSQGGAVGAVSGFEGPALIPSDPAAMPSSTNPPPRIVPVPQANPVPYQATGLRRLFDRQP